MSWRTPEPMDPLTVRINRERALIRESIPTGWEARHIRHTYDVDPAAVGSPLYGICGHGQVTLLVGGQWKHPFPYAPQLCSDEPTITHGGFGP